MVAPTSNAEDMQVVQLCLVAVEINYAQTQTDLPASAKQNTDQAQVSHKDKHSKTSLPIPNKGYFLDPGCGCEGEMVTWEQI